MPSIIQITPNLHKPSSGTLRFCNITVPCQLGKNGTIDAKEKREGDGKTPLGIYPIRRGFFRKDRLNDICCSAICLQAMHRQDGWCDDAHSPSYNKFIKFPLPSNATHAEHLWRHDHAYDVLFILGHNDEPVHPFFGSAIFFHLTPSECTVPVTSTQGCIAITKESMKNVILLLKEKDTFIEICSPQMKIL